MEEISQLLKQLNCDLADEDFNFEYFQVFKNPNKLPINQLHLEQIQLELPQDSNISDPSSVDFTTKFVRKKRVVPALHKDWLPSLPQIPKFQPYDFTVFNKDANGDFARINGKFLQLLQYLLRCDYHQFWCSILFETGIVNSLHSYISNPIMPHELQELDGDNLIVYEAVFTQYYLVYRRMLTYNQSESEFMPDQVAFKYLTENKLLTLPIVIVLLLMYKQLDPLFVNDLVDFYFNRQSIFRDKEVDQVLEQFLMTLDMIGGHVCGFEPNSVIVPIAIQPRPAIFSLNWVYNVVNYLLNTVTSLNALLKFHKPSVELAMTKKIPYRLTYTYEHVYRELYDFLKGRDVPHGLQDLVLDVIALGRSEFIDSYHAFVSYCLDETLKTVGNATKQEEFIEMYLKLMTTALDDEYFVCDYHERYNILNHSEMFVECSEIDTTRTDYLISCVESLKRHNHLQQSLRSDRRASAKAAAMIQPQRMPEIPIDNRPSTSKKTEKEIDELITSVIDMFPHLGDGFVLKCLEAYDYQPSDVIAAILEENLPPHISEIQFDLIRIPPEPKAQQPILAYRGKKPDYDDALTLLNDKRDMEKIKTFVLDGIQYSNEYDVYDDEYDDREDEEVVRLPEYTTEDVLKYNPNYEEDVVSDTSYSENEYDEEARPVDPKKKGNFCEDPALIRARREATRNAQAGRSRDVAGKPKGQGQDKNVLQNRQKKNTNKSTRANHSRKSGAQFKRNRGMVPS